MYNGVYDKEQFAYMYDTLTKWLSNKISGISLGQCLLNKGVKKVYLYGLGEIGRMAYEDISVEDVEIIAFIDKNSGKYKEGYKGYEVLGLDDLDKINEDAYILVTVEFYFKDVMEDLVKGGVPLDRIISIPMVLV